MQTSQYYLFEQQTVAATGDQFVNTEFEMKNTGLTTFIVHNNKKSLMLTFFTCLYKQAILAPNLFYFYPTKG